MGWESLLKDVAAPLVGGIFGNKSSKAQASAGQAGLDYTKGVYNDAQSNFQPYMQAGQNGLNGLNQLASGSYSGFENSPDYLYARGQAQYGVDHGAAARGSLYSGGHNLDLANAMNGIASQNLGNYRNSLQWLGGLGQNAAAGVGNNGMQMAGQIGNAYNNTANAQATAYGAQGQALGSLAGSIAGAFKPVNTSSYSAGSDPLAGSYTNGFGGGYGSSPNYASGGSGTFWGY